jgi:hypothetical protein
MEAKHPLDCDSGASSRPDVGPPTVALEDDHFAAADSARFDLATVAFAGVQLVRHTIATGGLLVIDQKDPCRLTPIQFDLLRILLQQLRKDGEVHESVRGFVPSYELVCNLPWDTAHPDVSHLKQLIRRVRRRIAAFGLVLESHFGFGYRIVLPFRSVTD